MVKLRPFTHSDISRILELITFNVASMLEKVPFPYTRDCAEFFLTTVCIKNDSFTRAVVVNNELVGCVSLDGITGDETRQASIGYWIGEEYWGKGYATKAAELVIEYGFNSLQLDTIIGEHFVDNPGSRRVMEKCHFVPFPASEKENELKSPSLGRNGKLIPIKRLKLSRRNWSAHKVNK